MNQWNYYFSGILYGKIYEEESGLFVERLREETGVFEEKRPYREEDDKAFGELCSRSLSLFFKNRKEYEQKALSLPREFTTESGEEFTLRKSGEYFQRRKKFPFDLLFRDGKIYGVLMSGRDSCAVLVKKGMERQTPLSLWEEVYGNQEKGEFQPGPVYLVKFHGTFVVNTRDKEQLATDVYLPEGLKQVPAVLVRTPYGKGKGASVYYRFVQRGYAVVIQDTRGREDSTGKWQPEHYEVEDGDDTLNWIAAQEWSDGQAAMTGGSYLGYVQWAAAASGNPHLKAMLSSVCAGSAFTDLPRRGGCFTSGMLAWAFAMSERSMRPELMAQDNWDEILDIRPLTSIPEKALGHPVEFLSRWLEHKNMDSFWKQSSWKDRYDGPPVPALIMSGWFDDNGMGTTEALELVKNWPKGTWKAVLGPWKHSGNADYDLHGVYMGENALRYDMDVLCMKWLEHFLKGVENGIEQTAAVEYFTVGENKWKEASAWPPKTAEETVFYLGGEPTDGKAAGNGSICGTGILLEQPQKVSGMESYIYDPDCPAVHIVDMSENELEVPEDYTEEEKRQDILSFTTPVLKQPLTITGEARVKLFVSCDCPDTDFVVRITDVDENGTSVKLADGVLGAKYRNGFETPEYMEEGKVYEINIRTTKISNTFLPGHRMRLTVTSSAKNFIFPNSNTELGFDSMEKRKASIVLYRGGEYSSSLTVWKE
ncbi:MAG TPA: CocE/NonD family hydrolase [Candidatus Hungatella pullicola]|nr:CocE/NonD family hydrolase [Candidatus Hungatella pullicola]